MPGMSVAQVRTFRLIGIAELVTFVLIFGIFSQILEVLLEQSFPKN